MPAYELHMSFFLAYHFWTLYIFKNIVLVIPVVPFRNMKILKMPTSILSAVIGGCEGVKPLTL